MFLRQENLNVQVTMRKTKNSQGNLKFRNPNRPLGKVIVERREGAILSPPLEVLPQS